MSYNSWDYLHTSWKNHPAYKLVRCHSRFLADGPASSAVVKVPGFLWKVPTTFEYNVTNVENAQLKDESRSPSTAALKATTPSPPSPAVSECAVKVLATVTIPLAENHHCKYMSATDSHKEMTMKNVNLIIESLQH